MPSNEFVYLLTLTFLTETPDEIWDVCCDHFPAVPGRNGGG